MLLTSKQSILRVNSTPSLNNLNFLNEKTKEDIYINEDIPSK